MGSREAGYDWLSRHRIVVDHASDLWEAVKAELGRMRHKKKPGLDEYTDMVVRRGGREAVRGLFTVG